jgi:glycosyltransferase involved in cell wall biosynthesis
MIRSGGIDLDRFCPQEKGEARKQLGLPLNRRILIWVGTIFDFSGLEILVNAAPKICAENDEVDFLIIGDGPNKKYFMQMAEKKGVRHRMRFTGYIKNSKLNQWLSASDLALAPYNRLRLSKEDFTSYKIFEYLACGLPVVTSFLKGESNIHYIHEYNLGATVPPEDEEAFANSVLQVLAEKSYFTNDFVKRARETLRKLDVIWDSLVDQVENLCKSSAKYSRLTIDNIEN